MHIRFTLTPDDRAEYGRILVEEDAAGRRMTNFFIWNGFLLPLGIGGVISRFDWPYAIGWTAFAYLVILVTTRGHPRRFLVESEMRRILKERKRTTDGQAPKLPETSVDISPAQIAVAWPEETWQLAWTAVREAQAYSGGIVISGHFGPGLFIPRRAIANDADYAEINDLINGWRESKRQKT